ncbi:hypothetical protein [Paraglaciecola sp. 25GB23A]|uniref:hypothetical protein n=1 Tax=Paraglaciecola sp. 25GB23A TaxID=3156068 RepID=UPI0032AE96B4
MVFLVLDKHAFEEALKIRNVALWVGSNLLTKLNHGEMVANGMNVTRFNYPINPLNQLEIDDALETIKEHHPSENIWVQYANKP